MSKQETIQKREKSQGSASLTREKLLTASRDLFNSVGYYKTDTNKIAREAGFAPATFYKHFGDKREIFLEVYRQWVLTEWMQLREVAHEGIAKDDFIERALRLVLEHHIRWGAFRKNLRALSLTDDYVHSVRMEQRQEQLTFLRDILETVGIHEITTSKLILLQFTVEKICDAIADREVQSTGVSEEELFSELVEFMKTLTFTNI